MASGTSLNLSKAVSSAVKWGENPDAPGPCEGLNEIQT